MHLLSRTKFDLIGEFAGFIRNAEGKRRMVLRVEHTESITLKLPKELRRQFESRLIPGTRIAVIGIEYRDFMGASKWVVSHLRFLSPTPTPDPCIQCPIRVCAKKNCWKNGGREIFEQLQARAAELGLQNVINVKAVSCLDNCKRGLNVQVGKKLFERCGAETVDKILERVAQLANDQA
jgi:Thioredoxin-like [2Fe-2S] ferredoxin